MRSPLPIVRITMIMAVAVGTVPTRPAAAVDTPVATAVLAIRNRREPEDPTARKIAWSVKDAGTVAGTRGTAGDPRCISAGGGGAGGAIRFFSDRSEGSTEDTGNIFLPCAHWKARGSDTNPTGYVYVDGEQSEGPCKRITVTTGKGVKSSCTSKRGPLDYDLMPGIDQGSVDAVLRVGAADRYCGSVGATNGMDGSDGRRFLGRHAPAPTSCPVPFVCGDAHLVVGEQCDDGNLVPGDGCDAGCQIEAGYACTGEPSVCALICADGTLDAGETCDDGNLTPGDGCDAACQVESGYACTGEPSACAPICSDGTLDPGESCDDGNLANGDGCDAACQVEAGYACTGEPSVCTPGCGDGIVGGSEQCDDTNAVVGDGCSVHCAYEPLCLVTRDAGNPAHASLTKITPDGSVIPVTGVVLPGFDTALAQTLAVCGRRIYFNLSQALAGLEVALDGTVTPLPTFPLTDLFQINAIDRIVCSPVQDLVMTFETAGLFNSEVTSYRVDGMTGALTQAGRTTTFGSTFGRFWVDFHPVTHDVFFATSYDPPLGATPVTVTLGRIVYDAAGNLSVAQQYSVNSNPFVRASIDGLRFTADGSRLALLAFFDGALQTASCFGQFIDPGTTLPPISALTKDCTGPVPPSWRTFVPRPEGGPIAYYQAGEIDTAQFVGTEITTVASTPALNGNNRLLTTFDGRRLVALGGDDGTVATYDVASDLVTVTPNDVEPIGAKPLDGVLLPCPDLP